MLPAQTAINDSLGFSANFWGVLKCFYYYLCSKSVFHILLSAFNGLHLVFFFLFFFNPVLRHFQFLNRLLISFVKVFGMSGLSFPHVLGRAGREARIDVLHLFTVPAMKTIPV